MKRIYLATPYSHEDEKIRLLRFNAVNKKAGELMLAGYGVFSPISHSHPVALTMKANKVSNSWPFWEKQDIPFLEHWADELWVLQLDGWSESIGVSAEIKRAQELGKPVRFIKV